MSTTEPRPDPLLSALSIPPKVAVREPLVRFALPADGGEPCRPTYIIAMTARTGSTALGRYITRSGVLGDPQEYFNSETIAAYHLERSGAQTITDLLAYFKRRSATANGCFGVKANFWQIYPFIASGLYKDLFAGTRFIHLSRRDLLAQAISLYVAGVSGVWHRRADGEVIGQPSEVAEVPFDPVAIAGRMRLLAQEDANWRSFFAATGIRPLSLVYEDIADAMPQAVVRIGEHLDITVPPVLEPADGFTRLPPSLNAALRQRFRDACWPAGNAAADAGA